MTRPGQAAGQAAGGLGGAAGAARSAAGRNPATKALLDAAQGYAGAQVSRFAGRVGDRVGHATRRLTEPAERAPGGGGSLLAKGVQELAKGASVPKAAASSAASGLKETVKETVKERVRHPFGAKGEDAMAGGDAGGDRTPGPPKVTNIIEDMNVGVPVRVAYDQWTQYQEFNRYMKGVEGVEKKEETKSAWRAKVWFSHRNWQATVLEQVPDDRIVWTSEGPKGTTKGVVSFHSLGPSLTKILLVMEYYPSGLFEKTGNLWRAQGRRARLDLKNFRRFITLTGHETGAWRGEIRDGEIVKDHDEAVAEEQGEGTDRYDTPSDLAEDDYDEDTGEDERDDYDQEDLADEDEGEQDEGDDYDQEDLAEEDYAEDEDGGGDEETEETEDEVDGRPAGRPDDEECDEFDDDDLEPAERGDRAPQPTARSAGATRGRESRRATPARPAQAAPGRRPARQARGRT